MTTAEQRKMALEDIPGTGRECGRDPRKMTADELRALGHVPMPPMKAIRARCIDCCGGSAPEVRLCPAIACPSWPYRMGKNPWRSGKALSEAQLANLAKLHGKTHD